MTKTKYTEQEQIDFIKADLLNDARCAEEQAANGPFYPERNITRESLLAYAAKCRLEALGDFTPEQFINGNAAGSRY